MVGLRALLAVNDSRAHMGFTLECSIVVDTCDAEKKRMVTRSVEREKNDEYMVFHGYQLRYSHSVFRLNVAGLGCAGDSRRQRFGGLEVSHKGIGKTEGLHSCG